MTQLELGTLFPDSPPHELSGQWAPNILSWFCKIIMKKMIMPIESDLLNKQK